MSSFCPTDRSLVDSTASGEKQIAVGGIETHRISTSARSPKAGRHPLGQNTIAPRYRCDDFCFDQAMVQLQSLTLT